MEITDIIIRTMNHTGKLKAIASCTFDSSFVVHDIKVIESQHGLFIAMPSRKSPHGSYIDIAHPINSDFRAYISDEILSRYSQTAEQDSAADTDNSGLQVEVTVEEAYAAEDTAEPEAAY